VATPDSPGPPKLKSSEPIRSSASPLERARISSMPIDSPEGFFQSSGARMVVHCHRVPSGRGSGASPPPWTGEGAGQSFQSRDCFQNRPLSCPSVAVPPRPPRPPWSRSCAAGVQAVREQESRVAVDSRTAADIARVGGMASPSGGPAGGARHGVRSGAMRGPAVHRGGALCGAGRAFAAGSSARELADRCPQGVETCSAGRRSVLVRDGVSRGSEHLVRAPGRPGPRRSRAECVPNG
jgi:hypothetical protein